MRRPSFGPAGLPIWRLMVLGSAAILAAFLAWWCSARDGPVDAEARYDGVHLCSPKQREKLTATPSGAASATVTATTGESPMPSASPTESPSLETPTASPSPGEAGGVEAQTETSAPGTASPAPPP